MNYWPGSRGGIDKCLLVNNEQFILMTNSARDFFIYIFMGLIFYFLLHNSDKVARLLLWG